MSPTIFRQDGYRFFFSREEPRMHVHVGSPEGEAKFWMEPRVQLAVNYGLSDRDVGKIAKIIEARADEIREAWSRHFDR